MEFRRRNVFDLYENSTCCSQFFLVSFVLFVWVFALHGDFLFYVSGCSRATNPKSLSKGEKRIDRMVKHDEVRISDFF